ncbi:hypothetical protein ACVW0I_004232 [Bradyrhizobium sp. LM6.11]
MRSRNFWIFPVDVFGIGPNITAFGVLKPLICERQKAMISASLALAPSFSSTKAQGTSPHFRIGLCDHGGEQHGRVLVEDVLDLDGGNVLAAGNDDVLGAILDDDIAMRVEHAEVAGVKPAAFEGVPGRLLVLEVALHHDVAAEHDLADGLAIARHLPHGLRIDDGDAFLERVGHALPPLQAGALGGGEFIPAGLLGADRGGAVDLCQAVDMRQLDSDVFRAFEYRDGRRGAGDQTDDMARGISLWCVGRVDQRVVDDRRPAHVGDAVLLDQLEDFGRLDLAQADIDAGGGSNSPGETPPVAVEHRQRPEINRMLAEIAREDIADGIQICAAMMGHDALGIARGARRVT